MWDYRRKRAAELAGAAAGFYTIGTEFAMNQSDGIAVPSVTHLRLIAGVVVFVLGVPGGVGGAMWILPPS